MCSNFDSCAILNSQAAFVFKTMSISWEIPRLRFFYTPCIFIFCETAHLEVFYKAAVITLDEIKFGRKNDGNYFSKRCIK